MGPCQCLWRILPPQVMWMSLVWNATRDHVDVQRLCRASPTLHCLCRSGELSPCLLGSHASTVELTLVAGALLRQLEGVRELALPLIYQ